LNWLDPQTILLSVSGYAVLAVAILIFIETSFILTSFLPGDSLLFVLGVTLAVSGTDLLRFGLGVLAIWFAAFTGSQVGFEVGAKIGPPLFERNHNWIFNPKTVAKTHQLFERYGARAVILARFVPIVRALVPMLAGIGHLERNRFTRYNLIGASIWVIGFMSAGYFLGEIQFVKTNLDTVVLAIVVITSLPLPIELLRAWITQRARKAR
jgi:membrane-associated protein